MDACDDRVYFELHKMIRRAKYTPNSKKSESHGLCPVNSPASLIGCVACSKGLVGEPDPAFEADEGGYADWVIAPIHGLREFLDDTYRRLLDVHHEMHGIVAKLDLPVSKLPEFTTGSAQIGP